MAHPKQTLLAVNQDPPIPLPQSPALLLEQINALVKTGRLLPRDFKQQLGPAPHEGGVLEGVDFVQGLHFGEAVQV